MDKITENIYIGNSHDAIHEKDLLKKEGITAILNVAFDLDNKNINWKDHNIDVEKCGLVDGGNNSDESILSAVYQLLSLAQKHKKVLVHCHEGKSRSVIIVAIYLSINKKITVEKAIDTIKEKRNIEIKKELYDKCVDVLKKYGIYNMEIS